MNNFRVQSGAGNDTIIIRYYDVVDYRALQKSLGELQTLTMPKRARIVLDFREVQSFQIRYSQIINFRSGLRALFPKEIVSGIAIINAPKTFWGDILCSSTPFIENDLLECDFRCFGAHQAVEAYQCGREKRNVKPG